MNELQKKISEIGVVPVIKLSNPERDAKPLAQALCDGGAAQLARRYRVLRG